MRRSRKYLQLGLILLVITGIGTGCLQTQEDGSDFFTRELSSAIAPSVQVEENYYRGLYPFVVSQTRGTLQSNLGNYRLDADRLELGLIEFALDSFPIEEHLFREGQIITQAELTRWLRPKSESNRSGLNPEGSPDRVLIHVLEHNYWNTQGDALKGIVLGLSLASTYTVEREAEGSSDGTRRDTLHYTEDELRNIGARLGDQIAERIRAKVREIPSIQDIPIVIALYKLEDQQSLVPGNFISVGYVEPNQNYVSKWEAMNETYFLFPSNTLTRFDRERSTTHASDFSRFKQAVQDFFPNYIGLIGTGRFIDEQLVEITIDVTTEFSSKTEVIQLTQFLGGTAMEAFANHVHINIYVKAINNPQSVFVRPADGEPIMHIYR